MSGRLGNPFSQVAGAAAVTANGRVMTFTGAVGLATILAVWTASATVGNRTVQVQIKDGSGNILQRLPAFIAITAGQTVNIIGVNAATFQSFTGPPLAQTIPLAADMPLPSGSSITVVDTANIDPTDTCSIAASLTN